MLYIFDLDHTVIDSSHRQLTRADGSLDLDNWIENCTYEKIMQDRLLPLAASFKRFIKDPSKKTAICTARVLSKPDYEFLALHDMQPDYIMSRALGDSRADDRMTFAKISRLLIQLKIPRARWRVAACIIDDNLSVLNMAENELKINALNAIDLNQKLQA